jgi:hypothetical protein
MACRIAPDREYVAILAFETTRDGESSRSGAHGRELWDRRIGDLTHYA